MDLLSDLRWIAILEDDALRAAAMDECLATAVPDMAVAIFQAAPAVIGWLQGHLGEVKVISLDHDLMLRDDHGDVIEAGTGRDVADYLAALPAACAVIVHSSNMDAASGMYFELRRAGWECVRVYPSDDLGWINDSWPGNSGSS